MCDALLSLWSAPWFPAANVAAAALLLVWPAPTSAAPSPACARMRLWAAAARARVRGGPRPLAACDVRAALIRVREAAAMRNAFSDAGERTAAFEQLDAFDELVDHLMPRGL